MSSTTAHPGPAPVEPNPLLRLRRLAQRRPAGEQCEFCSEALAEPHRHCLEVATRKIVCACTACALRFENVLGKWKLIPRDTRRLCGFRMSDTQWEALSLPINLAFMLRSTPAAKVLAFYPSPAGATESLLPLNSWEALIADNPILNEIKPDVEALLVNRLKEAREYFLAPIDRCFELVGLIRLRWRGLSGGEEVWQAMDNFFKTLREDSSEASPEGRHA